MSKIEEIFSDLMDLLKHGSFTYTDLKFMKTFLEKSLEATNKLIDNANKNRSNNNAEKI